MFSQEYPSQIKNLFRTDAFLLGLAKRYLSEEAYLLLAPKLSQISEDISARVKKWGEDCEKNPPRLKNTDAFGNRIDELQLSQGWHSLAKFAAQNKMIFCGYDKKLKSSRRSAQAAMQILFSSYSSTYSCPLAMTDGAVKLLGLHAAASIKEEIVPKLLARNEKDFSMCGQWMTEKIGGSDVRGVETHAILSKKIGDLENYRLYGQKWFCSAIDSEFALVLANIAENGPSLFLLRVWHNKKLCPGIRIDGLKNKLGTKALPTAEISLTGAEATLIGEKGHGIGNVTPLLNITRFYNALASASNMNRCYFQIFSYAKVRKSFGKRLIDHPLHYQMLADLDAKRAGATALCFEIARLLNICEDDSKAHKEQALMRALIPIAKMFLGKWAVMFASDAMEAIGGVGYIEDTEFPQMLRDAQVLPIWEGCTNILALDLIRAQKNHQALEILLREMCERVNRVMIDESDALRILRNRVQQICEKVLNAIKKDPDNPKTYLEPIARRISFAIGSCVMAILLAEAKPFITEKDPFSHTRFTTFVENNLCGQFSL